MVCTHRHRKRPDADYILMSNPANTTETFQVKTFTESRYFSFIHWRFSASAKSNVESRKMCSRGFDTAWKKACEKNQISSKKKQEFTSNGTFLMMSRKNFDDVMWYLLCSVLRQWGRACLEHSYFMYRISHCPTH